MKVLLISPHPPPYGGIANWTAMMLDYVKDTEDIFSTIDIAPKKRSTEGRNIFDRVVVSGLDMLKKKRELKAQIQNNRPDVIHMTTSGSLAVIRDIMFIKIAKKFHVPIVYHLHFGKTKQAAEKGGIIWILYSCALRNADSVIAIDNTTYNALKESLPDAKAELMPNPINTKKLPKLEDEPKKQVVFLGWVVPTKGVSELVEAWNTVGDEYPDYKLLIIGQSSPEYLQELKSNIKAENIIFAGEMPHEKAMEAVAQSKVFILPSYSEGFPYVVLEAMALKKPVIASAVGAIPEMLANDCGILINPKSSEEIISALRKVLSDKKLRGHLSTNALSKVNFEYEIETVYKQYKEIWNNVKERY